MKKNKKNSSPGFILYTYIYIHIYFWMQGSVFTYSNKNGETKQMGSTCEPLRLCNPMMCSSREFDKHNSKNLSY